MHYNFGSKEVTLVDEHDQVIEKMPILEAHQSPFFRHRAISVWLVRQNTSGKLQVLLQQRSQQKLGGGWWANGVCGNVKPGEAYSECAERRLREELNIKEVELQPLYKFEYQAYCNEIYSEHEIDQVFIAEFDEDITPNLAEVAQVKWIPLSQLQDFYNQYQSEIMSGDETLKYSMMELMGMTPSLPLEFRGEVLWTAPWTLVMLKGNQLWQAFQQFA